MSNENNTTALKASVVCLILGCGLMLFSVWTAILYGPLLFASFVLSIVAMTQKNVGAGIAVMLSTILIPLVIFGVTASNFATELSDLSEDQTVDAILSETESESEITEPVSVEPKEWQVVETFTGSGIKNTSQFTVNSNEWKIEYSSTASAPEMGGAGHIFQVWMLEPGQESYEGEIVVNEVNKVNISGETNIYKSGRFYFNSNSANGDWELKVLALQ